MAVGGGWIRGARAASGAREARPGRNRLEWPACGHEAHALPGRRPAGPANHIEAAVGPPPTRRRRELLALLALLGPVPFPGPPAGASVGASGRSRPRSLDALGAGGASSPVNGADGWGRWAARPSSPRVVGGPPSRLTQEPGCTECWAGRLRPRKGADSPRRSGPATSPAPGGRPRRPPGSFCRKRAGQRLGSASPTGKRGQVAEAGAGARPVRRAT